MDISLDLDTYSDLPMYQRIAQALRAEIVEGRLCEGEMLPSSRELALALGVSRPTVCAALELVGSQGYIRVERGVGSFIVEKPNDIQHKHIVSVRPVPCELSEFGQRLSEDTTYDDISKARLEILRYYTSSHHQLPLSTWRKLSINHRHLLGSCSELQDTAGDTALLTTLLRYLARARDIGCDVTELALCPGYEQAIDTIFKIILKPGDCVAIEDPEPRSIRNIIEGYGGKVVPIPVDDQGMVVRNLASTNRKIKFVYVTPPHQDPLGITMSERRRGQLLHWASDSQAIIIEDDRDHHIQYHPNNPSTLRSLTRLGNVIYLTDFNRVLAPLVSFCVVVMPEFLKKPFLAANLASMPANPLLMDQRIMSDFINLGLLERHIQSTKKSYAAIQRSLIMSVTRHIGDVIRIGRQPGSMHLVLDFDNTLTDETIESLGQQAGLPLFAVNRYSKSNDRKGQFIAPFTRLALDKIDSSVMKFARLLKDEERVHSLDFDPASEQSDDLFMMPSSDLGRTQSSIS